VPRNRPSRILVLPMADELHGSSRLRAWQYVPYFERAGMEVRVVNRIKLSSDLAYGTAVLRGVLWANLVFLQKRFLPGWLLRTCRALGRKVVYDFDDAIFLRPDGSPSPHVNRLDACLRLASKVIAGNGYLAEYARRLNPPVRVLPTPVPSLPFAPRVRAPGRFVLGWIGSKSTIPDLAHIGGALKQASAKMPELVVRVVSAEPVAFDGVRVENVRWQLDTADAELGQADAGIMPLRDNPFTLGKCAYKALQCMALGRPVIVTPIGMSREVVTDGREGLWAATEAEWVQAICRLHANPEEAARMAAAAHAKAQEYRVELMAERLVALVKTLLPGRCPAEGVGA